MRTAIIGLFGAFAWVGVPHAAHAEGCAGSDTDTSDSSSSSSSDDSSSTSTPACVETTDVLGYRECTRFGTWSDRRPGIVVAFGTATRSFASPLGTRTNTVEHEGESFRYRVVGPTEGASADTAVVATLRAGVLLGHGTYAAVEGELGGLTSSSATAEMITAGTRGTPTVSSGGVLVAGAVGVVGAQLRLGGLGLGLEAAGGLRALTYSFDSAYGACTDSSAVTELMPVLEGRARAELWVTPFVSIGATAGRSLVDDAWLAGLHVGFASRAFGR